MSKINLGRQCTEIPNTWHFNEESITQILKICVVSALYKKQDRHASSPGLANTHSAQNEICSPLLHCVPISLRICPLMQATMGNYSRQIFSGAIRWWKSERQVLLRKYFNSCRAKLKAQKGSEVSQRVFSTGAAVYTATRSYTAFITCLKMTNGNAGMQQKHCANRRLRSTKKKKSNCSNPHYWSPASFPISPPRAIQTALE